MNLYKQYLEVKKQNPDALVFYHVGDFYELFGQDAITVSEILNLTLTGRDCGLPERVPICGVPYHNVDSYIAKLVQNGLKAAICEPMKIEHEKEIVAVPKGRLNLTATGTEQMILKDYLEANASNVLAEKINNGIKIVKDGKTLINKKTLETFLDYACEEARKIAEKGAKAAAVKSDTVFGWTIHYFEEDSIEGKLYNEDGTEYKPAKPAPRPAAIKTTHTASTAIVTPPKPKAQFSLFDMIDEKAEEKLKTDETEIEADEPDDDESETDIDEPVTETEETPEDEEDYPKGLRQVSETAWADEDGVIYEVTESKKENIPSVFTTIFGNTLILR